MEAQMRTMSVRAGTDLYEIAAALPPNFTGADFSALTTEAYMIAVKERISVVQ
jgi:ATP-dependent 26S proteasome regulatory subunit